MFPISRSVHWPIEKEIAPIPKINMNERPTPLYNATSNTPLTLNNLAGQTQTGTTLVLPNRITTRNGKFQVALNVAHEPLLARATQTGTSRVTPTQNDLLECLEHHDQHAAGKKRKRILPPKEGHITKRIKKHMTNVANHVYLTLCFVEHP